jgi:hypothetical protein
MKALHLISSLAAALLNGANTTFGGSYRIKRERGRTARIRHKHIKHGEVSPHSKQGRGEKRDAKLQKRKLVKLAKAAGFQSWREVRP